MNLFITLLENVNKSRTSANNVSLNIFWSFFGFFFIQMKVQRALRPYTLFSALQCSEPCAHIHYFRHLSAARLAPIYTIFGIKVQ
jgi:hypothetical protein